MSEPTGTQYGGFWVRFLALLADSAIVFLVCAALLIGATMLLGPDELTPVLFAVWLLGILYWPVMHASRGQATFGKAIVGLKVARFDGRRISILRSLWRELAKIVSAALLMLGYLMAAVLPRKQGLHDLLAATYVVREGSSHAVAALAIAVAGFALPVVIPMVVDAGVIKTITATAEGVIPQNLPQDLMKQVPAPAQELMKQALGPMQDLIKQAPRPANPAPKAAPKPPAAPRPVAKPPAPKNEPIVVAQSTPAPPEPAKPAAAAEPAKPESAKPVALAGPKNPKAEAAKPQATRAATPKPPAPKVVARANIPPAPPITSKTGSGPRYNDIMTAVMYRDAEGVNELLRLGKWPDKPDSRGTTPLMVAAGLGDVRTAEALLRGGANARLAVPVAEERHDDEMISLLKRYRTR
jgi:uncharacterized RDD family membrane protein YckC